ncbi:MAG: hypothetical protein HKP08_13550 [Flavobacteriaceae bacterium]|nr:hypothetical protein [Flavobacteriaceae bacterium]
MSIRFSRIVVLFSVFLSGTLMVTGQDHIDLASFSYTSSFERTLEDTNIEAAVQEWNLNLDLPLVLDNNNALIFGLSSTSINVDLSPSPSPATNLYGINLRLGWNTTFNERWSGTFVLIPKVASDFSSGFRKGNQIGAVALLTKTKTNRLKYIYGLYGNTEEFGLLLVPIVGMYYKSASDLFEADIFLPVRVDLNYSLNRTLSTGLRFDGLGSSFSIQKEGFNDHYVTRASNELYLYGQLKITPSLLLRGKFGYSFFRNFKVYNNEDKIDLSLVGIFFGNNREILNQDLNDSFQFKFEMVYRFNLVKSNPQP